MANKFLVNSLTLQMSVVVWGIRLFFLFLRGGIYVSLGNDNLGLLKIRDSSNNESFASLHFHYRVGLADEHASHRPDPIPSFSRHYDTSICDGPQLPMPRSHENLNEKTTRRNQLLPLFFLFTG